MTPRSLVIVMVTIVVVWGIIVIALPNLIGGL